MKQKILRFIVWATDDFFGGWYSCTIYFHFHPRYLVGIASALAVCFVLVTIHCSAKILLEL